MSKAYIHSTSCSTEWERCCSRRLFANHLPIFQPDPIGPGNAGHRNESTSALR